MLRNVVRNRHLEGAREDFLDHQFELGRGQLRRGWSRVLDFVFGAVATFSGPFVRQGNRTFEGGIHRSEGDALTGCGTFTLKFGELLEDQCRILSYIQLTIVMNYYSTDLLINKLF